MKTPKEQLADILSQQGWNIEKIQIDDLEWWADEIWELKSIWSPIGIATHISFLIDPQYEGLSEKGTAVWGVGNSHSYPRSREEAESNATISMNDISNNKISDFINSIAQLRSRVMTYVSL